MKWKVEGSRAKMRLLFVLVLVLCVVVDGARPPSSSAKVKRGEVSKQGGRRSPVRVGADQGDWIVEEPVLNSRHRDRILYRSHRQAEDSYEDNGDYDYEEENGGGAERPREVEEGDAPDGEEEYYDNYEENGGNGSRGEGDEEEKEERRGSAPAEDDDDVEEEEEDEDDEDEVEEERSTTTTTTTTPEPYVEEPDPDEGMDSEQYEEERYESERRRYEISAAEGYFTEPPSPPPPPPPASEEERVEEGESTVEPYEEVSSERRREETEESQYPPDQHHNDVDEVEEHEDDAEQPTRHQVEEENGYYSRERGEEEETTTAPHIEEEKEEDASHGGGSQEIAESGRDDLERYTQNGANEVEETVEEEEAVEEEDERRINGASMETQTTSEPEVEEEVDPYRYQNRYEEEEEEDVDEETTTVNPPHEEYPPHRHHVEEHEEALEREEDEHEEAVTEEDHYATTEPPTTTNAPTTTTREPFDERRRYEEERPYDPDRYDEEEEEIDEEEDEDDEDNYYRRPVATVPPTTTTTTTTTPEPPRDSLEEEEETEQDPDRNEVHGLSSEEERHRHRYEYEHTTEPPTTTTPAQTTTERVVDVEGEEETERGRHEEEVEEVDSAENEIDTGRGRYETEDDILRWYTTAPTTTTPPPPSLEEEEEENEEERRPSVPYLEIVETADSSENRIFNAKSEEEEDEHIGQVNRFTPPEIQFGRGEETEQPVHPPSHFDSLEEDEDDDDDDILRGYGGRPEVTKTEIECFAGYALSHDGAECLDVDECGEGVCGPTQICLNVPGSYVCSCPSGFLKDFRNPRNCRDINECEQGSSGCSQDCVNTPGSYYCSCADDFRLDVDGKSCIHIPTTTTTTTTTTTPPPPTSRGTIVLPRRPTVQPSGGSFSVDEGGPVRNCPTPPVPRGAGIAYLYCSRSPVGIHHRHSQLERKLLQDWAARKNRTLHFGGGRHPNRFRHRRNLKRRLRQTTYSPGSMCELRCRPGFQLKGQYTLHCNSSAGTWIGPRDGYCTPTPRAPENQTVTFAESTPSNEIPRLAPNEIGSSSSSSASSTGSQFRPSFVPQSTGVGSRFPTPTFRPNYYQPPPPAGTTTRVPTTPTTTMSTTTTTTTPPPTTTAPPPTTTFRTSTPLLATPPPPPYSHQYGGGWSKPEVHAPSPVAPSAGQRRPYYNYNNNYYYTPSSSSRPTYGPPLTTTTMITSTTQVAPPSSSTSTTARNSYIQLTYRFKTPWIKCPDDMKVDLASNQNTAYVIIPQPQTNVDWWRQVTSEPAWAKGLETEVGPGRQRITFRARTSAPANNTAECSFYLEVRDTEAPRVRECPESFTTRLSPGQASKAVNWIEPQFSDNVRIVAVKKSHEPGVVLAYGEHFVNYEAKDSADNKARCSFTVNVLPPNGNVRRPVNTDTNVGSVTPSTSITSSTHPAPVHSASLRNVVCHVGKKGRRIVFLSRVVPRGCSEMTLDVVGDSAGQGAVNTVNTITQGSAENSATSQISSVSFSSHDHPQSASAFSQAVSNGRNNNRLVHSTSSVTTGNQGTSSRASSYAVAISSSSRNFDLPFIAHNQDKQIYDEDFVVPQSSQQPMTKSRSGGGSYYPRPAPSLTVTSPTTSSTSSTTTTTTTTSTPATTTVNTPPQTVVHRPAPTLVVGNINSNNNNGSDYRKYFRHFDSWDSNKNRH